MPPSQWVSDRQSRMARGRPSPRTPGVSQSPAVRMLAPVVVKPLADSKTASVTEQSSQPGPGSAGPAAASSRQVPERWEKPRNGSAPNRQTDSQPIPTMAKPSRWLIRTRSAERLHHQVAPPASRVTSAARPMPEASSLPSASASSSGASIDTPTKNTRAATTLRRMRARTV